MFNYGKIAEVYDDLYTTDMCMAEDKAIASYLYMYTAKRQRVLDLGCGTGHALTLAPYIKREDYTGIDISEKMLAQAENGHPGYMFLQGTAEDIEGLVEDGTIDTALCLFCIPYIGKAAAKALYKALKPGGVVLCVRYKKPYLNPSSVYGGHKWRYRLTVAPKVSAVNKAFDRLFEKAVERRLAGNDAYEVVVYRKGGGE